MSNDPVLDKLGPTPITARAVVIALLISLGFAYIIPYVDVYLKDTFLGAQHLPPGSVFMLLALTLGVNPLLRLISPRAPLTRTELLYIYCMTLFSTLVPGHGAENVIIPVSVTARYFASPENKWEQLFHQYIPDWFAPTDPEVVRQFYEGLSPGASLPWSHWYVPMAVWGGVSLLLYVLVMCLSVLFRRQWADHEKLVFPLVALPLEMTSPANRPEGSFYGNKLMWVGFGVAVVVQVLSGLKYYYPSFPGLKLFVDFQPLLKEEPWRAMGWTPGYIWPSVIGITFLLRSEISFSLWFFYWFTKAQTVIAHLLGYRWGGRSTSWGYAAWLGYQPVGGYLAYVGISFYAARQHLKHVWEITCGRAPEPANEGLSYRAALTGAVASLAALIGFCLVAGMSFWPAAVQISIYVVIAMSLSKVVVESGLLFVQATFPALDTMALFAGTRAIGARSMTIATFIERGFMTDLRAFLMPSYLQSLRIADLTNLDKRGLLLNAGIIIILCTAVAYWRNNELAYRFGALRCNEWWARYAGEGGFKLLGNQLQVPLPPDAVGITSLTLGGLFTLGLYAMRQRFTWFTLHPVGFIMMHTYPMIMLWFSIFLGWVCKAVVMRYGGYRGLQATTPLFLGVAFGDITMMVVWLTVDAILGKHDHFLLPG